MVDHRSFGLDGMRATAILLVVFGHVAVAFGGRTQPFLQVTGYLGVEIFFVLSGFLIGRILIKTVVEKPKPRSVFRFWVRRWMRTLPAYWFVGAVLIAAASWNVKHLSYLVFLQNVFAPELFGTFFGVAWSLAIEEWFYLITPVALTAGLLLLPRRRKFVFFAVCAVMIGGSLILRTHVALTRPVHWWEIRQMILPRFDAIGFGVTLAGIEAFFPSHFSGLRNAWRWPLAFMAAVVAATAVIMFRHPLWLDTAALKSAGFVPVPLACALLLPIIASPRPSDWPATRIAITFISVISYSVYLVHWDIIQLLEGFNERATVARGLLVAAAALSGTLLFAWVLHVAIEQPLMMLRDRYSRENAH